MPKPKKNPVTEMPVVVESPPEMGSPGVFESVNEQTQSKVIPLRIDSHQPASERDWTDIDCVLSDVVSFV
ncbi:MAG: hypothetical protein HC780_14810 [Leptolyngbyaceae cyanobacterium CSU_1_3]|nr:hypothetical protein [Leptolyngbyaceae cyanobacterium CSU_1_3]